MERALSDIRVLDVTQVMAGPFCAMLLCDMGADVIKIEPPQGDSTRGWEEPGQRDTAAFNAVNRGKRGVVVNLKTSDGRAVAQRLAGRADILIENYRPGVMASLGLDYDTLRATNRGLIYTSISGYGQTGPDADKGGFDLVAQGVCGIMSVTGETGRPPVKAGVPVTDLGAGLFALGGILAALHHRTKTGDGQRVDTSLVEAGLALSVWEASEYFATGVPPRPCGSAHRMSAPYQAIRCADGYITLGGANDRLFVRLSGLLGHPEWSTDPRFSGNALRVEHRETLADLIEAVTSEQPRAHWLTLLETNGIPCGPINSYAEALSDEHLLSRKMVVETEHPTLGRIRTLGTPLKLTGTPLTPGRPAPTLGQHTDEVLAEAGYDPETIARFRDAGTVQ